MNAQRDGYNNKIARKSLTCGRLPFKGRGEKKEKPRIVTLFRLANGLLYVNILIIVFRFCSDFG